GVILSQILRGISKGLDGHEEVSSKEFAIALKEGSNSAYKAVMRPTEGTILSVVRATAEAGEKSNAKDVTSLLEEVTVAAKVMLDKTPDM
ncbi:MAG: DAK2 domain-containing protein, partial [Cetobacterium sp.]